MRTLGPKMIEVVTKEGVTLGIEAGGESSGC